MIPGPPEEAGLGSREDGALDVHALLSRDRGGRMAVAATAMFATTQMPVAFT